MSCCTSKSSTSSQSLGRFFFWRPEGGVPDDMVYVNCSWDFRFFLWAEAPKDTKNGSLYLVSNGVMEWSKGAKSNLALDEGEEGTNLFREERAVGCYQGCPEPGPARVHLDRGIGMGHAEGKRSQMALGLGHLDRGGAAHFARPGHTSTCRPRGRGGGGVTSPGGKKHGGGVGARG